MATYYVSASGTNNASGDEPASAWSYTKLNSVSLTAGDTVLFRRNDTFTGALMPQSGVTYSTYGSGAQPLLTSLMTLANWTAHANRANIYYTPVNLPELNVLLVNSVLQPMGRYPKTGWITYTGGSNGDEWFGQANRYILSDTFTSLPINPVGSELVIRKIRQITDRHVITSQSGNRLNLAGPGGYLSTTGNNSAYCVNPYYGCFFQNSLDYCTAQGDWYFDSSANRLYIYFASAPTNYTIQTPSILTFCDFYNLSDTTFANLTFEGAHRSLFFSYLTNRVSFLNCTYRYAQNGIMTAGTTNSLSITSGTMHHLLNTGVLFASGSTKTTIDALTLDTIGHIAGAGLCSDGNQLGLWCPGDYNTIKNCTLTNMGYHGIVISGKNCLVTQNTIDTYGFTKDDSAGIYTFATQAQTDDTNSYIINNIIRNAARNYGGIPEAHVEVSGIYLDANSRGYRVLNNLIQNGAWSGIFLVDIGCNNTVNNNTIENWDTGQVQLYYTGSVPLSNLSIQFNQFNALAADQYAYHLHLLGNMPDLSAIGTFNHNRLIRSGTTDIVQIKESMTAAGTTRLNLLTWRTQTNQDLRSFVNPQKATLNGKSLKTNGSRIILTTS